MTNTLFEEPDNVSWVFDLVNTGMLLVNIPDELSISIGERMGPKDFVLSSLAAIEEYTSLQSPVERKIVPAKSLLPTQNRLNVNCSLHNQLTNKWNLFDLVFEQPTLTTIEGPHPVLVFADKYIIDGHHRWSQYMMTNPSAEIDILNIPLLRPSRLIEKAQESFVKFAKMLNHYLVLNRTTTICSYESIVEEENLKNSFKMDLEQTKEYINSNITEYCLQSLTNKNLIPSATKEGAVDFYIKNIQYILPLL